MAKRAEYLGPRRRRPLVLDAALDVIAEGGYAAASMSAIAERARVSKAVLYACYSGGKQEIYFALLDRLERTFLDHRASVVGPANGVSVAEALRAELTALLDYADRDPGGFRIMFGDPGTAEPAVVRRAGNTTELIVTSIGDHAGAFLRGLPLANLYSRLVIAVGKDLARLRMSDPSIPRARLVESVVVWFMKGFESVTTSVDESPLEVRTA